MAAWLPLIMPRPELFQDGKIPDIGDRDKSEILTFGAGRQNNNEAGLWSETSDGSINFAPVPADIQSWKIESDSSAARTLVSLPIFTWVYIFAQGHADIALHDTRDVHASNIKVHLTRSFVTWTTGPTVHPTYRVDRMKWCDHVPKPDMSDLPDESGLQVILPFDRPSGSAHEKMRTAARLEPDLRLLSKVLGWPDPLTPRRINMPRYMA